MEEGSSHFIPLPKQSLQSNGQDLVSLKQNYGKISTASRPKFGIPFMSDPNFLRGFIALIKKNSPFLHILESNGLWTLASSVKG
jgi:hypothetical protein